MTDPITGMLQSPYPAVLIEQWSGHDGWPCFRVMLASTDASYPAWDGVEHPDISAARQAARSLSAEHGDCPIHEIERGG